MCDVSSVTILKGFLQSAQVTVILVVKIRQDVVEMLLVLLFE